MGEIRNAKRPTLENFNLVVETLDKPTRQPMDKEIGNFLEAVGQRFQKSLSVVVTSPDAEPST